MDAQRCDELRQVALEARRTDEAAFLAAHRGPCLVLVGSDRSSLSSAVVVPTGEAPVLRTLGRHPENDIVAPWPSISRRHAMIVVSDDSAWIVDRGSANGTFVGTERLVPDVARLLRDGDEVRFGSDVHAIFLSSRGLLARARSLDAAA